MTDRPSSTDDPAAGPTSDDPGAPAWSSWVRVSLVLAALVLLTRAAGWWGLVIVLGLVFMIVLHELGHFIMAKRAGMKVTEFFIGFGPRIWSTTRGETEYGLKVIPAGAYVRIVGMSMAEEVDPADEDRTYRVMPFWQRFGVAVAGSTMHFIQALVLIFVLLVFFGQPGGHWILPSPGPQNAVVGSVYAHCPSAQAGLQPDDQIVAIDGHRLSDTQTLGSLVGPRGGEPITLTVRRDGKLIVLHTTLAKQGTGADASGLLGVTYGTRPPKTEKVRVLAAIPQAFHELWYGMKTSVAALGKMFTPKSLDNYGNQVVNARQDRVAASAPTTASPPTSVVDGGTGASHETVSSKACIAAMGGPPSATNAKVSSQQTNSNRFVSIYGIFRLGSSAAQDSGVAALLGIFALINIFIGVFNLTPMLPFDGGHIVVAVYEKIQEWRLHLKHRYYADLNKLLPVVYAVILVLGLIFVSSLYLDIANPPVVK